jgi:hypothetical protein
VRIKLVVLESGEKKKLEHAGGGEVLSKLGGKNAGLPFFAFVDPKGELIVNSKRPLTDKPDGANIGHPFAPEEIAWFMTMLKKAAPKLESSESKTVEDWLRNQKK